MANTLAVATAPMSTHEICTVSRRSDKQQCHDRAEGLSSKHKELVEKTWGMVEEAVDLQSVGYILFRK